MLNPQIKAQQQHQSFSYGYTSPYDISMETEILFIIQIKDYVSYKVQL